jgi:hypothetical protein
MWIIWALIPKTSIMGQKLSDDEAAQTFARYEPKNKMFRNKEELLANCRDDVNVLRQACFAFRNLV